MSQLILQKVVEPFLKTKKLPRLRCGLTVRVHQKITEGNKERIQIFEGLVIKMSSGEGICKSFTVRKVFQGVGVEKIFPLYAPCIDKIAVIKEAKVRRAKLYYIRERAGKSARLREKHISSKEDGGLVVDEIGIQKAESQVIEENVEKIATE
ncbi:50S ribosomal protein L19 [Candidatus Peregrinibacteria bacterium]|nr:50S ribosomal protein L19 [Candidatus Peregrinibacteria bacterium]